MKLPNISNIQMIHMEEKVSENVFNRIKDFFLNVFVGVMAPIIANAVKEALEMPLNIKDLSDILGMTTSGVKKRCLRKQIPYYYGMDGKVYFDRSEIKKYLLHNKVTDYRQEETTALPEKVVQS